MNALDFYISGSEEVGGAALYWMKDENGDHASQLNALLLMKGTDNAFLKSLDIAPVLEAGKSRLFSDLAWSGSPLMMSLSSVSGHVSFESKEARFLKGNATTDAMKLINVFNFDTWARRLKLDFSDLYQKGVSYDEMSCLVKMDKGVLLLETPLVMTSPSSTFSLQGSIDTNTSTLDSDLNVTLPVSKNATWVAALAGGLPAAAGAYLISKVFEKELNNLSTVSYHVSGTLDEPDIKFRHLLKDPMGNANKAP